MSVKDSFLTKQDEDAIVAAIQEAEKNTSGEIRVHIEAHTEESHYKHAEKVFQQLQMHQTKQRNGVLIYIATQDHKFVILGDEGINKMVSSDFWNATKNLMQDYFRKGNFKEGIVQGILMIGKQLKEFFPYQEGDQDELPNEISKSE